MIEFLFNFILSAVADIFILMLNLLYFISFMFLHIIIAYR